ncbi:MAG: DUF4433 domain-containing protein [Bacteroidaceae bacterium]|nr:DUF4433 domain-containing protein [Bacteroidaceae bacterium]
MNKKKNNWQAFKAVLEQQGIKKLYHFTDRDNLTSIIQHGGLYSWADCKDKGITIPKPGGSSLSWDLDKRGGLEHYVRVSFVKEHPMMYVAMNDGRISNPVLLEIDTDVACWENSQYADRNATKNGRNVGGGIDDLKAIHFHAVKARKHFDLDDDEQKYFQAEVLVKNFIPLSAITNIGNFGYTIPSQTKQMQTKIAYTAQITRDTPTAFIFLIDQSVSMQNQTTLHGERMTMSEAVARIVNNQINELVLRCVKGSETRHYYDIAVIGYGKEAYWGWNDALAGRDFVSPEELKNNPYKKIITREEVRTRRGTTVKEVEKVQWIEARHDGSWTHVHKAFDKAKELLEDWMEEHHDKDCYPPTIINITDGVFNGATKDKLLQQANELKSMFTNDGNVLLFNIHITPDKAEGVLLPIGKNEVRGNAYSETLFDLSSLLPTRYNADISKVRNDADANARHTAMAVNADMSTLIQLMDIGTPTNIIQNK